MVPHVAVVGGTGMLAGLVEALAVEAARLSLFSRHASRFARADVEAYDVDYHDEPAFAAALHAAGPVDLAVAWFHTLKIPAPRRLAERVGRPEQPGRLFQILGSAVGDPSRPDRLTLAAGVAAGLANCRLRQVVLGFKVTGGVSRWLTHDEIAGGVLQAVLTDSVFSVVGQVGPWSARP